MKNLGKSNSVAAIQDNSKHTNPEEEAVDPDELPEEEKQKVLENYLREKKKREEIARQRSDRIQRELEKAAAADTRMMTPAGTADFAEQREGSRHDMAPGMDVTRWGMGGMYPPYFFTK